MRPDLLLVKDYVSSLSMPKRHTAPPSGAASPPPREKANRFRPCPSVVEWYAEDSAFLLSGLRWRQHVRMRRERRLTGAMEPRCHPVIMLICFALVTNSIFAACPTHTGAPPEEAPHFDLQNYATGDWFGLRNTLYDYGIEITGGYTTEPAGNPVGGIEHGFTYLHNFGFGVLFDLQKIAGISDTTFLVTVSQRSGQGLTQKYIGNAISVQQIFGGGQTYRLVQVRMEHKLFDDRLELAYGRLTATADFLSSPFYCQFVNNGICGQPPAPFFNMPNGITAYPQGTWGGLVQVHTTKETYAKFGVL